MDLWWLVSRMCNPPSTLSYCLVVYGCACWCVCLSVSYSFSSTQFTLRLMQPSSSFLPEKLLVSSFTRNFHNVLSDVMSVFFRSGTFKKGTDIKDLLIFAVERVFIAFFFSFGHPFSNTSCLTSTLRTDFFFSSLI